MPFLFRMSIKGYYFIFAIIPVGLCLMFGTGIGFFTVNNLLAITLTSISGGILIIGMILFSCCSEVNLFCILGDLLTNIDDLHYLQSMTVDKFFYSLKIPIFLAYVLVIPIMMNREILTIQSNKYYTIKQILYAIFAGYDIVWACLFIDLAWAIFILIARPYRRWSDYFLECGNCFITVAVNSLVLYSIYQDSKMLSIDVAIPLIAVAFVPAIVSLYVFFSHDFGRYEGYTEDDFFEIISGFSLVLAPVAWIIYGLNLPLIDKKVFKPEI